MVTLGKLVRPAPLRRAGATDLPILSMTMRGGLIDQSAKFKKRIASDDISTYKVVRYGQLVVGFPIDEGVLDFQVLYPSAVVSPAYGIWDVVDAAQIHTGYLQRFLRSPIAIAYYRTKLRGSTARRRSLPMEVFSALEVPLPPIPEQRRIAAILDHADALRAKRRHSLTLLDELAQEWFIHMFGDPIDWPSRWTMALIGDAVSSVTYGSSSKAGAEGKWPILRMGNLTTTGRIDLSDLKYLDLADSEVPKYTVGRGDLLFNRTNSPELVGKTAVVRTDRPLAFAGYLIRVRTNEWNNTEFISAYLNTRHGKAVLRGMNKAIVGQANINAKELQLIAIAQPPKVLQDEWAEVVLAIEYQRAAAQRSLDSLDELFASLQSRAFSGQL